jgi:hypothetical protein
MLARIFKVVPDAEKVTDGFVRHVFAVGDGVIGPRNLVPPVAIRPRSRHSPMFKLRLVELRGPERRSERRRIVSRSSLIVDARAFCLVVRAIVWCTVETKLRQ